MTCYFSATRVRLTDFRPPTALRVIWLLTLIAFTHQPHALWALPTPASPPGNGPVALDLDMQLPPAGAGVRSGTLSNGLRWIILQQGTSPKLATLYNGDTLKKRALAWLVVQAGTTQETQSQRGSAQVLAELARTGNRPYGAAATKRQLARLYAGQKILKLDKKFNLNEEQGKSWTAWTAADRTVFGLALPAGDVALFTQGLKLLRHWVHAPLESQDLLRARASLASVGLLHHAASLDESLLRAVPVSAAPVSAAPVSAAHPQNPLNLADLIKLSAADITTFRAATYRPKHMTLVVLGHVDLDDTERAIRAHFGSMKPAPDVVAQPPRAVRPRPGIQVMFGPEERGVRIAFLDAAHLTRTVGDLRARLVLDIFRHRLATRLGLLAPEDETHGARAPVLPAIFGVALSRVEFWSPKDPALNLIEETRRMVAYGVDTQEIQRYMDLTIAVARSGASRKDRLLIGDLGDESILHSNSYSVLAAVLRHHMEGELPRHNKTYLNLLARVGRSIQPEDIAAALINLRVVLILPSTDWASTLVLAADMATLATRAVTPWSRFRPWRGLDFPEPTPGRVVAEQQLPKIGAVMWTLSNGAKVLVKQVPATDGEISFSAVSPGGASMLSIEQLAHCDRIGWLSNEGIGPIDSSGLREIKHMDDNFVPFIFGQREMILGKTARDRLESYLRLTHHRLTRPPQRPEPFIERRQLPPSQRLMDLNRPYWATMGDTDWTYHRGLRKHAPSTRLGKPSFAGTVAVYRARFGNAGDFTFLLTGAVSPKTVRPLVERYLASLPATQVRERCRDVAPRLPTGVTEIVVRRQDELKGTSKEQTAETLNSETPNTEILDTNITITLHQRRDITVQVALDAELLGIALAPRVSAAAKAAGGTNIEVSGRAVTCPRPLVLLVVTANAPPKGARAVAAAMEATLAEIARAGLSAPDVAGIRTAWREAHSPATPNDWSREFRSVMRLEHGPESLARWLNFADDLDKAKINRVVRRMLRMKHRIRAFLEDQSASDSP